jgi:predicted dehydrogenase
VAIVGCGKIADGHAQAIRRTRGLGELVAACDVEPLMAEQFALRMGVRSRYSDFDRMLVSERPDVVHIATPPSSHVELAMRAMDAGAHVFCEKPLAVNHAETLKLIEHVERTARKLTIGWDYFFDPPALRLRELVANGVIGDPVHVESTFGFSYSGPFGDALLKNPDYWVHRLPGGLLQNVIDHLLNKAVEFVADESPEVVARSVIRSAETRPWRSRADEVRILIAGRSVTAYATFSAAIRPLGHFLRVYGTRNTIHADFNMRTVVVEAASDIPSALGRLAPAFSQGFKYLRAAGDNVAKFARADFHYFAGLRTLVAKFYESIINDAPPPVSYRDISRVSAISDEIFRQLSREGRGA